MSQRSVPLRLVRPWWEGLSLGSPWVPLRLHLHCLLGTWVATQCDPAAAWTYLPQHLAFSVWNGLGAVLLCRSSLRERGIGLVLWLLGAFFVLRSGSPVLMLALYVAAGTLAAATASSLRRGRAGGGLRLAAFALGHAVLPFLAGYAVTGHRPGASALLLSVGFLGLSIGAYPSLRRLTPSRTRTLMVAANACVLLGVAALSAWLLTYGAGISGLFLAAPGALLFLWCTATWSLHHENARAPLEQRRNALLAWLTLQAAIALATWF